MFSKKFPSFPNPRNLRLSEWKSILNNDEMCNTVGKDNFRIEKKLGSGSFGSVYKISIGTNNEDTSSLPKEAVVKYHRPDEDSWKYAYDTCNAKIENNPDIEKNALVCINESISETLISKYLEYLYQNGYSINFFPVYNFGYCDEVDIFRLVQAEKESDDPVDLSYSRETDPEETSVKYISSGYFTIMPLASHGNLEKYVQNSDVKKSTIEYMFTSVLHAIGCMQMLKISHGDLKTDNILVDKVRNDRMKNKDLWLFHSANQTDPDEYAYDIVIDKSGVDNVVAKISDFGFGCMYQHGHQILNYNVSFEHDEYTAPFFHPSTDIIFLLCYIYKYEIESFKKSEAVLVTAEYVFDNIARSLENLGLVQSANPDDVNSRVKRVRDTAKYLINKYIDTPEKFKDPELREKGWGIRMKNGSMEYFYSYYKTDRDFISNYFNHVSPFHCIENLYEKLGSRDESHPVRFIRHKISDRTIAPNATVVSSFSPQNEAALRHDIFKES
jgi:serine/threonine protein kinase